ncbi:MAG: bifunctional precorrin-2 dehydrogenase/sirohydrochlorin ferrochelatase [Desulfovibrio sp.]|nr:bifunctional precorrin-2 dehydrogenase/sirohydrochlorin ferrochelatase [Desulfovibrio sp.]
MLSIPLYPAFISLKNFDCLIAGLGNVGRRKLAGLIVCEPRSVSIFDPAPDISIETSSKTKIYFFNRVCEREDIEKSSLVFACAGDPRENDRIARICEDARIFCDTASGSGRGSFIVPASVRRGDLVAAISTSGASPALARLYGRQLAEWLKPRARMTSLMKLLRPLILRARPNQAWRQRLIYAIIDSPVADWLENNERERCLEFLTTLFPAGYSRDLAAIIELV